MHQEILYAFLCIPMTTLGLEKYSVLACFLEYLSLMDATWNSTIGIIEYWSKNTKILPKKKFMAYTFTKLKTNIQMAGVQKHKFSKMVEIGTIFNTCTNALVLL